jgi:energy-coupling factor transporter ATP-binding protein EcfA2
VRGPNGSGKSTFLLELKGANPDQVFYLPSSFEQLVWQGKQDGLSTGQRMMRILAEIRQMDEVKVLLLDEWDANLDQENTRLADDFLDALAREKVVVEVRH